MMSSENEEDEGDTICNEDYKEKQVDENGREYIDYWTCGGPCVVVIWYRSTPTTTQYILGALSGDSIKKTDTHITP